MNPNLKALYVAIYQDKVIAVESNLKSFTEMLSESYPSARNYMWFRREFEKADYFKATIEEKEISFQRLL